MSLSGTATATEGPRSLADGSKTGSMAIERGWETGSSTTFARVVERGQRTKAGSNEVLGWQQDIGRDANGLVRTSSTMAKALSEASGLLAAGSTAITRPAHTRMLRTSHVGSYRGVVLRDVTRRITWHARTIKPSSDQALTQRENKDPMATPSLSLSHCLTPIITEHIPADKEQRPNGTAGRHQAIECRLTWWGGTEGGGADEYRGRVDR